MLETLPDIVKQFFSDKIKEASEKLKDVDPSEMGEKYKVEMEKVNARMKDYLVSGKGIEEINVF